jgi:hypothetical protein
MNTKAILGKDPMTDNVTLGRVHNLVRARECVMKMRKNTIRKEVRLNQYLDGPSKRLHNIPKLIDLEDARSLAPR